MDLAPLSLDTFVPSLPKPHHRDWTNFLLTQASEQIPGLVVGTSGLNNYEQKLWGDGEFASMYFITLPVYAIIDVVAFSCACTVVRGSTGRMRVSAREGQFCLSYTFCESVRSYIPTSTLDTSFHCEMPFSHHSHSGQFCKHAAGTLEEVVLEAIRQGFRTYGLTEHVPRHRLDDLYPEEVLTSTLNLQHISAHPLPSGRNVSQLVKVSI